MYQPEGLRRCGRLSAAVAAADKDGGATVERWATTSLAHHDMGGYAEAATTARTALALDAAAPLAAAAHGLAALQLGDVEQAWRDAEMVRTSAPSLTHGAVLLAGLYTDAGRYDDAVSMLDKALDRFPVDGDVLLARADVLSWAGDDLAAVQDVDSVLGRFPQHAPALAVRAVLLLGLETSPEPAFRHASQAAELEPRCTSSQLALAATLLAMGQIEEARTACGVALRICDRRGDAVVMAGAVELSAGRPEQALRILNAEVPQKPSTQTQICYCRAVAHRQLNRPLEALEELDRALHTRPNHVEARALRAQMNLEADHLLDARKDALQVLKTAPQNTAAGVVNATTLLLGDRPHEAITECRRLLASDPVVVDLLYVHGIASASLGHLAEVRHDLSRLTELVGTDDPVVKQLQAVVHAADSRAARNGRVDVWSVLNRIELVRQVAAHFE